MLLVAATQAVVPRETRVPLSLALTLHKTHRSLTVALQAVVRETVPTNRTVVLSTSTRMMPLGRTRAVHRVPARILHKRGHQTADPLNVDARFNWGVAAYREGRWADAAERWREVLRLDPGHPPAREWLPEVETRAAKESAK